MLYVKKTSEKSDWKTQGELILFFYSIRMHRFAHTKSHFKHLSHVMDNNRSDGGGLFLCQVSYQLDWIVFISNELLGLEF